MVDTRWGTAMHPSYSTIPTVGANAATIEAKGSVITNAVGIPKASICTASCKLHAVHAPQSPRPLITK